MGIDVFISYHTSTSSHITKAICNCLEATGIRCWYAPRDTVGSYANSITNAISECKVFVVVLNREASFSEDVLNEMNLAFERVRKGENIVILPFHTSTDEISNDAKYYLGRIHWIDAINPPIEERIKELSLKIKSLLLKDSVESEAHKSVSASSLNSVLPLSNINFIGRNDELKQLEETIKTERVIFLHGLGGTGKTEIVKKYINQHNSEYDAIIFTRYDSNLRDMLISDKYFFFENISRGSAENGQLDSDEGFARKKLEELKKRSTNNTLIVVDNFDTVEDDLLVDFMEGPYKLIMTTRTNFDFLGIPQLHVDALKIEEQIQLFLTNYKLHIDAESKETINEIINLVGGHTLTVELIAKLMFNRRIKPEQMLEKLKKYGVSQGLEGKVQHGFKKADTIYSHIKELFRIEALSDNDKKIMRNLSLLPLSGVKVEDFMEWSEIDSCESVFDLANSGWIQYSESNDTISLYPVISDMVLNDKDISDDCCFTLINNLKRCFSGTYNMEQSKRVEYGEIAKSLWCSLKHSAKNFALYKEILNILIDLNYQNICDEIFETLFSVLSNDNIEEMAWCYYKLGDYCLKNMNYDGAIDKLKKSIEIYASTGANSVELAYVIKHLAHTYHAEYIHCEQRMELLEQAKDCLTKSAEIYKNCVEEESPHIGSQYYATALNYYYFEEYNRALEYAKKSLEIFMKIGGEVNSNTTAPMRVLARVYSKLGQFDEALSMQQKVIGIRKTLWGEKHFSYIEQFETLTDIYFDNCMKEEGLSQLNYILELIGENVDSMQVFVNKIKNRIKTEQ